MASQGVLVIGLGAEILQVTQLKRDHVKSRKRARSLKTMVKGVTPLELTANANHFSREAMEVPKRSVDVWAAGSACSSEDASLTAKLVPNEGDNKRQSLAE